MSQYVEYGGQLRANPEATNTNFLKLAKHDPENTNVPSLDHYEGAQTGTDTMLSVTIDGTVHALTTTTQLSEVETWVSEIENLLGEGHTGDKEEINIIVRAAHDGTDLSFEHQGMRTINAITTSGGAINLTRVSTKSPHADYSASVVGAVANLNDGTNTAALGNNPYNYSGTPATDATTAGTLKADIETALGSIGASFVSVAVTVNDVNENYDVVIHRKRDGKALYFGTSVLAESNACIEWDAGALKV